MKVLNKRILFGLLIAIVVSMVQLTTAINVNRNENRDSIENLNFFLEDTDEWETNYLCKIDAALMGEIDPSFSFGLLPRMNVNLNGWVYDSAGCFFTISGLSGTDSAVSGQTVELSGYFFIGHINNPSVQGRIPATMQGIALICKYKLSWNE